MNRIENVALLGMLVCSCGREDAGTPPGTDSLAAYVGYYEHAAPVLERRCVSCHQPGGIGPFSLATLDDAQAMAPSLVGPIEARTMPPMPPSATGCRELADPRIMPEAERTTLLDWIAQGAVAGDPAAAPPPASPDPDDLGAPTDSFDSGVDYLADAATSELDVYRCFVLDPGLNDAVDVVAASISATNAAVVHHAIIWAAGPEEAVEALDAADETPGYDCGLGASGGLANPVSIGAYVPGSRARPFPNGSGMRLEPGTRFVVQMHYNYSNGFGPNRLGVDIWRAQRPLTGTPVRLRVSDEEFVIAPNELDASASAVESFGANGMGPGGRAWNVMAHMHLLGRSTLLELVHDDGTSECLLDIDAWDFHWQGSYDFAEPLAVKPGDALRVTCHWDNTSPNQVGYGEASSDEMCMGSIMATK